MGVTACSSGVVSHSAVSQAATSASTSLDHARSARATTPARTANASSVAVDPRHGSGHLRTVLVPGADTPGTARALTYSLEIEDGIGADQRSVATVVGATLRDERGWQALGAFRFVQVTPAQAKAGQHPQLRIILASPDLVDRLCAPVQTHGDVSCGREHKAVLNNHRWVHGAAAYADDLAGYRTYMVNHEVGHNIGHSHEQCPGKGQPAPVMLQQTLGLQGCIKWPWPTPPR